MEYDTIEVVDQYYTKWRFPLSEYRYEWRVKDGSKDKTDNKFLDIFRLSDEDWTEPAYTFPNPVVVGLGSPECTLSIPFRQIPMEQCQRCGLVRRAEQ